MTQIGSVELALLESRVIRPKEKRRSARRRTRINVITNNYFQATQLCRALLKNVQWDDRKSFSKSGKRVVVCL